MTGVSSLKTPRAASWNQGGQLSGLPSGRPPEMVRTSHDRDGFLPYRPCSPTLAVT